MASTRQNGAHSPDAHVRLSDEDRRKLYSLLDADIPSRMRRIELGIVALFVMQGGAIAAGSHLTPVGLVGALVHLVT